MASQNGAGSTRRSTTTHETMVLPEASPPPAEDFEFCVLSSGGLVLASEDAAGMCAADEVFSGGKLLPLRPSSVDASAALLLPRSDSTAASTSSGFSSSSSGSSCVSRSTSSKSASSDPASALLGGVPNKSAAVSFEAVKLPPRRSLSSSVFYAHPSPSPRPPRRVPVPSSAARRSTESVPPQGAWAGVIRLGVVGAPDVYPRRRAQPVESRKVAGSQSARFEHASTGCANNLVPPAEDKKLVLGLLGVGLVCSCSPDAVVAPVGVAEAAAAAAKRRRKKAEDKKRAAKQNGKRSSRRSRILDWLEDLSMSKSSKNVV